MPRPNFERVPLFKTYQYIFSVAHKEDLDYKAMSPEPLNLLRHFCHPNIFIQDIDNNKCR